MLTFLRSSSPVLVMTNSMFVSICSHVHARPANSGKHVFVGNVHLSPFREDPITQRHKIWSQNTRDSKLSYGKNPKSISPGLGTVPGRDRQTPKHQDKITIANTHYIAVLYSVFSRIKIKRRYHNKWWC